MISHLTGTVIAKNDRSVTVDVGGVGYEVYVTAPLLENITLNGERSFFIYTAVREDDLSLYGFVTAEDLKFFKLLIGVSRIGPKSALEILKAGSQRLQKAIVEANVDFLGAIPGVGKKTAERIVLELKNKVQLSDQNGALVSIPPEINNDLIDALMRLGYQRHHVTRVLRTLPAHITQEKEIITFFLKAV